MTATWDRWFDGATTWASGTWTDIASSAHAAFRASADTLGLVIACRALMTLLPALVHFAWLVLLIALGAPLWFVLVFAWH